MLVSPVGRRNGVCSDRFAEGRSTAAPQVAVFCTALLDCSVLPWFQAAKGNALPVKAGFIFFLGPKRLACLAEAGRARGVPCSPSPAVLLPKGLARPPLMPKTQREVAVQDEPCPDARSLGSAWPASSGQLCLGWGWVRCLQGPASISSSKDERYGFVNRTGCSPWPKPCRAITRSRAGAGMAVGASGSPTEQRVPFSAVVSPSHKQIPRTTSVENKGVKQGCFQAISLSS